MNFVDMLPKIQAMASNMCKKYDGKFAVDELVNEAWLGSLRNEHKDAPLIMRAAQLDILDYIRSHLGRKENKGLYDKRCKHAVKRGVPNFITNVDDNNNEYTHGYSWLDGRYVDRSFIDIDNRELIQLLLKKTTAQTAESMIHYYLNDNSLVEAGKKMHLSDSTICTILRRGREELKAKAEDIGLDITCIEL